MKAKWISILAFAIPLCLLLLPLTTYAQWSAGIEFNMALPITGYGEVFKTGSNFNLEGKYHFNKGWGVGFQTGAARFANSKEGFIAVNNPKLTVVPLLFIGEYEVSREKTIRPFFAAGLGLSIFTFSYHVDNPAQSTNETNASFTISPQIGVRFFITENTMSYLKGSYVFVMDGPPVITEPSLPVNTFPESDKATGYAGIEFGFSYRFNK